ncbi:MAG: UDP-N-acetylmuramoyl-L-alanyl-D-glutamate--2,6-diaminopimelate ligase [Spirochaetales bacterium]|nr:UDP-N-acetylmuramoyl-L-alanyl-D-glutamate--2,6-diaminopimelate ligase [Spirochaetales bacterium]
MKQEYTLKGNGHGKIKSIHYDSRQVEPGSLFVAMEGLHVDGHAYIEKALEKGASAILHSRELQQYRQNIPYIKVNHPARAMSSLAAELYERPSDKLKTIGITGTDGKSSSIWFVHQWLELLGKKSGFISTVEYKTADRVIKNPYRQSTPEASEIHKLLYQMVKNQKEYACVETTSHGLSPITSRLADVSFDAVLFTNISHEHLEFHKTFENYRKDKANLFRQLKSHSSESFGVVNADDSSAGFFRNSTKAPVYSFSLENPGATVYGQIEEISLKGSRFILSYQEQKYQVSTPLTGIFNVKNLLAAFLLVIKLSKEPVEKVLEHITTIKPVLGRMMPVNMGQSFTCLIDYAHTPGAFKSLLPMIRPLIKGKLIMLFGSAGERDFEKREIQGRLAAQYADIIIITNEDPRQEDEMKIIEDIARGCGDLAPAKLLLKISDRQEAIKRALSLASENDCVLCLGKSHESSIIKAHGPSPWNEEEAVIKELEKLGHHRSI